MSYPFQPHSHVIIDGDHLPETTLSPVEFDLMVLAASDWLADPRTQDAAQEADYDLAPLRAKLTTLAQASAL